MSFRRYETLALVVAGVALAGVSLANSARIGPVVERQRADLRLVTHWIRTTRQAVATGAGGHIGRRVDTACAVAGVGGRVRVCLTIARPGGGPPRVVGGWHVPALAPNEPSRRYACWGEAAGRCSRAAPGGA